MGWKILDNTGAEKQASASGISTPTKTILTASSGTYTTPTGCTEIFVECVGGGGGGGGIANSLSGQVAVASGGGGGAYSASQILNPASTYSYAVGGGGNGGAAGANNGSAGSDTTFGSTLIVAKGGSGGNGVSNTAAPQTTGGVNGGAAASGTGQIKIDGGGSGPGVAPAASQGYGGYGGAGAVYGTSKVENATAANNGQPGLNYGGGGSGACRVSSSGNQSGGNGAAGIIIVTEYYGQPTASTLPVQAPTKTVLSTAGSGTYTVPANCGEIFVECWGAGGGSGGAGATGTINIAIGESGGGGSYAAKTIANPSPSYSYVVGGGGTAGVGDGASAGVGGTTSFGSTVVVAPGGNGGTSNGATSSVPSYITSGAAGGAAGTGDITIPGGNADETLYLTTSNTNSSGKGGDSPRGAMGTPGIRSSHAAGAAGKQPGGGASGGCNGATSQSAIGGAVGGDGMIVITEYYAQPQQFLPSSSSPQFSSQDIAIGPPPSPSNGDIWYATNVDANGTVWQFRYNANSTSPYRWEFVGGPPIHTEYAYPGGQTLGTSTFTAIPNLAITVPRAGDYIFPASVQVDAGAAGTWEWIVGLSQNSTTAIIAGDYYGFPEFSDSAGGGCALIAGQLRVTGAAANDVFRPLGWCNSTGSNICPMGRFECIPVRIA